jgi:chemotaxis protein MotB
MNQSISRSVQGITRIALVSLAAAGCVSKGTYEQEVQAGNRTHALLDQCSDESARLKARVDELSQSRAQMQKQLDDATVAEDQLSKELAKLGEDAKSLLSSNGSLKLALDGSRKRLDELHHAQAAAEARATLFHDLALKLRSMIDAGDLAISLRDGRMVLRLSNDVLFDSGKSDLKPAGRRALEQVASVLRSVSGRRFQIEGHTDDEPIRFSPFRSNWELSTARALEVVSFLTSHGMDPRALSAAGYGEFDPIESNETAPGKARNRRTEITVVPNIDEIVAVPDGE